MAKKKEPTIERDISSKTKFWIDNGVDLSKRRIMLDDEVDEVNVGYIIRALHKMVDIDPTLPIDIYISSFGGCCYSGLGLYDTIKSLKKTLVRTHAVGKVMSMGLILYLAGDERHSLPNTTFMAHSVAVDSVGGKNFEIKTESQEMDRLNSLLIDILESTTVKGKRWWKKEIEHKDKYYDVKNARKLGIITN